MFLLQYKTQTGTQQDTNWYQVLGFRSNNKIQKISNIHFISTKSKYCICKIDFLYTFLQWLLNEFNWLLNLEKLIYDFSMTFVDIGSCKPCLALFRMNLGFDVYELNQRNSVDTFARDNMSKQSHSSFSKGRLILMEGGRGQNLFVTCPLLTFVFLFPHNLEYFLRPYIM